MFSKTALRNLETRGKSPGAYLDYVRECFAESLQSIRTRKGVTRSIVRCFLVAHPLIWLGLAPLFLPGRLGGLIGVVLCSIAVSPGLLAWLLLHVGLVRDASSGVHRTEIGLANKLTILRFILVTPVVWLLLNEMEEAAVIVYLILSATDIADGIVARRRSERTQFGVVMDPLADVLSTGAVFAALLSRGLLPLWVFSILMLRYASLLLGSTIIFFTVGPMRFRATPVGKIVGVLQACAVIIIIASAHWPVDWEEMAGETLFPALGLMFGSVVVSQLVIGFRHIRRGVAHVGSRRELEGI